MARGTSGSPITFTSINDNSVGGSTGSGSPAASDWAGIQATGSGSIDLEHANISYTGTGVNAQTTGSALLSTVSIFDSSKAISDVQGDVSFRGQLGNDASGISSCDWGTAGCSVDAAYSYWGSPNGPPLGGQGGFVCGAVTTSPYLTSPGGSSTTPSGSAFGFGNCDGSQTPTRSLAPPRLALTRASPGSTASAATTPANAKTSKTRSTPPRTASGPPTSSRRPTSRSQSTQAAPPKPPAGSSSIREASTWPAHRRGWSAISATSPGSPDRFSGSPARSSGLHRLTTSATPANELGTTAVGHDHRSGPERSTCRRE